MPKSYQILMVFSILSMMTACQNINPLLDTIAAPLKQYSEAQLDQKLILKTAYKNEKPSDHFKLDKSKIDDYFATYPYVLLEPTVLGFIHPTVEYKNTQGENRYLVIIEKVNFHDGYIAGCRACSSMVDVLIYKKQNRTFELVNAAFNQDEVPSADGHLRSDFMAQLKANLQPFGRTMMGSHVLASFTGAGGQETSNWYGILLPDLGDVQILNLAHASGSTASYYADADLASTTTSKLKLIVDQSKYYPVEITYIQQGKTSKSEKSIFKYVESQHAYVETQIKK
ncbi:hypothetical protein KTJ32_07010 [Acinetobacter gyllenbergii]|uniref:hypothetical protein n=1 Tax=Acinetobacter gyllenbergii TaxID=134534 RepID=UPI0021CE1B32|nr:hypothetical protein [Acinetobacter gyllenbergii]MCU4580740.1 hypothetical protein [Acinetobacter gyllenbergii]